MSTPDSTPKEENKFTEFETISDKNNKYQIVLKNKNNSLLISCKSNDIIIDHFYEKIFSMEQIKENKYFYQFDTIDEIINEIILKNSTKKPLVKEGNNEMSLIIYLSTSKIKDAIFSIPEKKKNPEDKIEELYKIILEMKKEINELKEEVEELKNNKKKEEEMKKINLPVVTNNFKISSNPKVIEIGSDTYAKCTMDPFIGDKEHENNIWFFNGYSNWGNIQFYDNLESVKSKNYNEFKIPIKGYGTYWTIFKNCLYFSTSTEGNKTGKLNLTSNKIECEKTFNDVIGNNNTNQWGGYNDIIFISNPESLYIIYQSNTVNKMVIKQIDPDSLNIIQSWETDCEKKKEFGAIFMIGNTLFATKSYSESPTKIIYKYDLMNGRGFNVNIDFANIGGYDTSLHYCYQTNQLWTVNSSKFYIYDVSL